jgi:hypothetical protein
MANDPSLDLREAVVTRLRATSALTAITTADKVFGEQPTDPLPERPFTRYGVDDITPREDGCWSGATVEFPIHSFSQKKFTDEIRQMNAAVASALHDAVLDLGGGMKSTITWLGSTVRRDAADVKAWHGTARFRATV